MDLDVLEQLGKDPRPHLGAASGALAQFGQLYGLFFHLLPSFYRFFR
jgi:hypothetical protein